MSSRSILSPCFVMLLVMLGLCEGDQLLLFENFDAGSLSAWVPSAVEKYTGAFELLQHNESGNIALHVPIASQHYGLSRVLSSPLSPQAGFVLQYEVKHSGAYTCGGSYLKLISHNPAWTPDQLANETPFTVMFGPDKCGPTAKVHVIFQDIHPVQGSSVEHHLTPSTPIKPPLDSLTHVYTLRVHANMSFQVLIDGGISFEGSLTEHSAFSPPFQPPSTIPDPEDSKPSDWVNEAKIPDLTVSQPEDWDTRPTIPDLRAVMPKGWRVSEEPMIPNLKVKQPEEWDTEEDGEWTPPTIPNPKCKVGCGKWSPPKVKNPAYKGPWSPPQVPNPAYKGEWKARSIPNPHFYENPKPLHGMKPIGAVSIEIWTVDQGYTFDNIVLSGNDELPSRLRAEDWAQRNKAELAWKAAKDKAAAEEKEKAAELERVAAEAKQGNQKGNRLSQAIQAAFQSPTLTPIRPYVGPLLSQLERTPLLAYPLAFLPLLTSLLFILGYLGPGKRREKAVSDDRECKEEDLREGKAVEDQEGCGRKGADAGAEQGREAEEGAGEEGAGGGGIITPGGMRIEEDRSLNQEGGEEEEISGKRGERGKEQRGEDKPEKIKSGGGGSQSEEYEIVESPGAVHQGTTQQGKDEADDGREVKSGAGEDAPSIRRRARRQV